MKCKKCKTILPDDYHSKYCEHCEGERASNTKKVIVGIGAGVVSVLGIVGIALLKGLNSKNDDN